MLSKTRLGVTAALLVASLFASAAQAAGRHRPGPDLGAPRTWLGFGINLSHVEESEKNCFGGSGHVSVAFPVIVRLYGATYTYEADDDTDTCDGGFSGDSEAREMGVLVGLPLGQGFFVAGGAAKIDIEETAFGPWGGDTGTRAELGWSSRTEWNSVVGLDATLFHNWNDIREFSGFALAVTFGSR